MAINTHRTPRRTDEFLVPRHQTAAHVAPGTYSSTHNELNPLPVETAVPFNSLQEKTLNPNLCTSSITPGPGAYDARKQDSNNEDVGIGPTAFKSNVHRLAPTAPGSSIYLPSTIEKNPGPGTYQSKSEWEPKLRKELLGAVKPVIEVMEKTTPSIPLRKLLPGQQPEVEYDADVVNLCMRHTGENGDTVGPGEYEHSGEVLTSKTGPLTTFHASKMKRNLWEPSVAIDSKLPPRENPGPGSYESKGHIARSVQQEQEDPADQPVNTFQFSSRSQLAYQVVVSTEKVVPGPGQYDMLGAIDKSAKTARDRSMVQGSRFGSVTERSGLARSIHQPYKDPYHVHNVPGPAHYPDPRSSFPDDAKKKEVEKALPTSRKKQFMGVHHPTIVMALQEIQGPLQAFNSTDERPCNKELDQLTPAPWQYNTQTARGHSLQSVLRERGKVGRRGIFGTCADRFYGSPLTGRTGLPDPGMDFSEGSPAGANTEPRSMFQSSSPRFHAPPGPHEVNANKVGSIDTPAPGDYVVEKEPSYRSPFRHPRQDHLSFGSCKPRFDGYQDIFLKHVSNTMNPGPGEYNSRPVESRITGGAKLQGTRKPMLVGCTMENVGPGSYSSNVDTPMLKNTFNVSTQAPVNAAGVSPKKRMRGPVV